MFFENSIKRKKKRKKYRFSFKINARSDLSNLTHFKIELFVIGWKNGLKPDLLTVRLKFKLN